MKNILTAFALMTIFAFPSTIFACICTYRSPERAFEGARIVFLGKVTGGTEKHWKGYHKVESGKVTFDVQESFKGEPGKTVTIHIDSHKGTSCEISGFRRGRIYLVYAYDDEERGLSVGPCTRTWEVIGNWAKEDLDFLRSLASGEDALTSDASIPNEPQLLFHSLMPVCSAL